MAGAEAPFGFCACDLPWHLSPVHRVLNIITFRNLGYIATLCALALLGACGEAAPRRDTTQDAGAHDASPGEATSNGRCAADSCMPPAVCNPSGTQRCSCPAGYDDLKGDGSDCVDHNECLDARERCDRHATCRNTPGGYTCTCLAPAYVGDGVSCGCAPGYSPLAGGLCLADDGQACSDNLDCGNGHCVGGTCCAVSCGQPGDCRVKAGATCSDGHTCVYPLADDGTSCDDGKACTAHSTCVKGGCRADETRINCDDGNPCTDDNCEEPLGCKNLSNAQSCDDHDPCTQNDRCLAGVCEGETTKDCSGESDACNQGRCDPISGACKKQPLPVSTSCNDGSGCTVLDHCEAGSCKGSAACGPNATACTDGAPHTCTCVPSFVDKAGVCVPQTNECETPNACSADANCFDPSNTPGDVICSCKPGFMGNGTSCTVIDPCHGNPCGAGRGSCIPGPFGEHTCSCGAGYTEVSGSCVCDLSGTFAARTRLEAKWSALDEWTEAGQDSIYSYAIEQHSFDAQGNLTIDLTACGSTSLDVCGIGFAPLVAAEAYAQYLPAHIYELPTMPKLRTTLRLPNALPGSPFVTENLATLSGIRLLDPLGEWPTNRSQIAGSPAFSGQAVNGAVFADHDNDGLIGLTSFVVPPGGIRADGIPPDPIQDFGPISASCPRDGGAHTAYTFWPAPAEGTSLTPVRITRFFSASRVISAYHGKLDSCDSISGEVTGPNAGKVQLDARIGGCVRTLGVGETACSSSAIDFLDGNPPDSSVVSASFKLKRMPPGPVSCATVQKLSFD